MRKCDVAVALIAAATLAAYSSGSGTIEGSESNVHVSGRWACLPGS